MISFTGEFKNCRPFGKAAFIDLVVDNTSPTIPAYINIDECSPAGWAEFRKSKVGMKLKIYGDWVTKEDLQRFNILYFMVI